jgi:segregation and condensation protein B
VSTGNEADGSLAAAAAAWVPPWARRPEPERAPDPPPEPDPDPAVKSESAPEPGPVAESPAAEPRNFIEVAPSTDQDPLNSNGVVAESGDAAGERQPGVPAHDLRPALEAILLVVDEPVSEAVLAEVFELPAERIDVELTAIAAEYEAHGRGFELRRAAGGWRLYTRPEYGAYVERFVLDGQSVRLTQAALETLAVIAYKQSVTRSRISAIRGVNCDGTVRTLVTRGLIEQCGTEPETGAYLYRTTVLFLEKLGLDSVEQLPALAPYVPDNVDEIADVQQ